MLICVLNLVYVILYAKFDTKYNMNVKFYDRLLLIVY